MAANFLLTGLCCVFIFLLLTATMRRPNCLFSTPDFLVIAQNVNICGAAEGNRSTPAVVEDTQMARLATSAVLIFQTSFDLRVPCPTALIWPPRYHEPPVRVIIASPTQKGTYPVILFKHGFSLANCFYTQLFEYLASSGYIVVAPQAVSISSAFTDELDETAKVVNWIPKSLAVVLNAAVSKADVVPNVSKLVMAGHSRGGKIAFAMVLGMASTELPSFSALVTLDPVDGMGPESILKPALVAPGCEHTHNQISFPVLILGTGLSSEKGILGAPACAPTCCNHAAYFNCSSSPVMYHFLASDYGHLDFLDDSQFWTPAMCKSGGSKALLRDFSGKLIIAFLESALEGKQEGMNDMIKNWENAAITLEEPQIYSTGYAQSSSARSSILSSKLSLDHVCIEEHAPSKLSEQ